MAEYRCPTCKKALMERGDFFPFCSERCKLVELGAWMTGKYAIPGPPASSEDIAETLRQEHLRRDPKKDDAS